jgi:hypothetical protein
VIYAPALPPLQKHYVTIKIFHHKLLGDYHSWFSNTAACLEVEQATAIIDGKEEIGKDQRNDGHELHQDVEGRA